MNNLQGQISNIQVNTNLSLVSVKINENIELKAIVVETPKTASYLQLKNPVKVLFKETEVILATNDVSNIGLLNKIKGTILTIEKGILLSKITIDTEIGEIISIIATEAINNLNLTNHKEVVVMIKINEIMLSHD
ncbi:TOBE domain-containing protein [Aquimarina sp. 2201CG5-10]|uniref:TOBE domain-containing protein n=1 Tax=Aquimarina callyspongiae TaxID=3098150 RepID=UPI002AB560DF|nr:TOBE domain-containing protein [Aquimarina sp. 2201CG5-10]MDY8137179.1 TOBE domain-containing protein [Aquimarina sp. 2201CG5-10]